MVNGGPPPTSPVSQAEEPPTNETVMSLVKEVCLVLSGGANACGKASGGVSGLGTGGAVQGHRAFLLLGRGQGRPPFAGPPVSKRARWAGPQIPRRRAPQPALRLTTRHWTPRPP